MITFGKEEKYLRKVDLPLPMFPSTDTVNGLFLGTSAQDSDCKYFIQNIKEKDTFYLMTENIECVFIYNYFV